jgi:hypothetical protein
MPTSKQMYLRTLRTSRLSERQENKAPPKSSEPSRFNGAQWHLIWYKRTVVEFSFRIISQSWWMQRQNGVVAWGGFAIEISACQTLQTIYRLTKCLRPLLCDKDVNRAKRAAFSATNMIWLIIVSLPHRAPSWKRSRHGLISLGCRAACSNEINHAKGMLGSDQPLPPESGSTSS